MKGHLTQRSPGSWSLVIDLGRDPTTGKRRQKWQTVKGTKKDAQRELIRTLHEMDTGAFVEPSKLTVAEYLEKWLAGYAAVSCTKHTHDDYAAELRRHVFPSIGNIPLSKLQPLHIQDYIARGLERGRLDGKGGLSPKTMHKHFFLLKEAFARAVRWGILGRNPADALDPPKVPELEMRVLSEAEIRQLLVATVGHYMQVPILLAVGTGMRRNEILGLQWADVNLDAGAVKVRQSLLYHDGAYSFKTPKTEKGRRTVQLPSLVVEGLIRHRGQQAEQKLLLGPAYHDQGLVCATATGGPLNPTQVSTALPRLLRQAGLPVVRFHDLRHSHATHLLAQGEQLKVVSERLGHAKASITLDIYSHVLPGQQEEAARKVDRMLRGA